MNSKIDKILNINGSEYHNEEIINKVLDCFTQVWTNDIIINQEDNIDKSDDKSDNLNQNLLLLKKLGYYNPGAIEMEGEWYPLNRIHHLERRLLEEEGKDTNDLIFGKEYEEVNKFMYNNNHKNNTNPNKISTSTTKQNYNFNNFNNKRNDNKDINENKTIELFYSFRSPYSQLVIPRLKNICKNYNCSITVKPLLPMVTRGLPVPPEKEMYIATDAAREARLWGILFGKIVDPLHPNRIPFLRALDAYSIAKLYGLEINFIESYGINQWGKGISAGTDSGLKRIMIEANMNQEQMNEVFLLINKQSYEEKFTFWEKETENNRKELFGKGLWGVPSLKYKDMIVFGQDKLWVIEKILKHEDLIQKNEPIDVIEEELYQNIVKYTKL